MRTLRVLVWAFVLAFFLLAVVAVLRSEFLLRGWFQ
jgi:hypothetical protein